MNFMFVSCPLALSMGEVSALSSVCYNRVTKRLVLLIRDCRCDFGSSKLLISTNATAKPQKGSRSPPTQSLPRAAYDCEPRVDVVSSIARTDAHQIVEPTETPIATHKRAQAIAGHHLVAIEMGPTGPFSKAALPTKALVQIVGNTHHPKLQGI